MAPQSLPDQLTELSRLLAQMCTEAATSLRYATTALVDCRDRLAERVIVGDVRIDALRVQVEAVATEALVLQAPVAGDLRAVVSAIRSAGEVERMGDLALHIAEAARRRHPNALPPPVRTAFTQMGGLGVDLARKASDVVASRNVLRAVELDADDDAMDELHRRMFGVLMHPTWPHGVAAAVDVTLLARYYERFADHAVAVARETVYAVTGGPPEDLPT